MKKKNLNKLQIKIVGELDWRRLRDLMVLKLSECQTEEDLIKSLNMILGSMFTNAKEIDKARKEARLELLTEKEKQEIKLFKGKKQNEN